MKENVSLLLVLATIFVSFMFNVLLLRTEDITVLNLYILIFCLVLSFYLSFGGRWLRNATMLAMSVVLALLNTWMISSTFTPKNWVDLILFWLGFLCSLFLASMSSFDLACILCNRTLIDLLPDMKELITRTMVDVLLDDIPNVLFYVPEPQNFFHYDSSGQRIWRDSQIRSLLLPVCVIALDTWLWLSARQNRIIKICVILAIDFAILVTNKLISSPGLWNDLEYLAIRKFLNILSSLSSIMSRKRGSEDRLQTSAGDEVTLVASSSHGSAPSATSEQITLAEGRGRLTEQRENEMRNQVLDSEDAALEKEEHLRDCILYCSLFPAEYEFTKDILIWSWIAAGVVNQERDDVMEEGATRCFDWLIRWKYILPSGYDHLSDQMRYKLGGRTDDFISKQSFGHAYRKSLDNDADATNIQHLSLIFDRMDHFHFEIARMCIHLKTLLLHKCFGSKIETFLNDLFLELKFLTNLDLSCTEISELPASVENLNALRYLDLSKTPIRRLPESMDSLLCLETLMLHGCPNLWALPKCMKKLTNLQHLVFDDSRQLQSMPPGMGKLTKLQTLRIFCVGTKDGNRINELRNMDKLKGSLGIMRLENVRKKEEARQAFLCNKQNLRKIELRWSDAQDAEVSAEEEILESLQPHFDLRELKIVYYSGGAFPSWIGDSSFTQMVSITLYGCKYCKRLPCLGELPSLEFLSFVEMESVVEIDCFFCLNQATSKVRTFPRLKKLSFDDMPNLERWAGFEAGHFPSLQHLIIKYCPKLVSLPSFSPLISLRHLEINHCPKLPRLPEGELPSSVKCFTVKDSPIFELGAR